MLIVLRWAISAPWGSSLVHPSRRLKCTIVIMRCPSSVVVNFSHFRLLLWNCWMEFNETWQEARSQHPLPSLCFSCHSEKQNGRPGLWLAETFMTCPLKPLNGIQWNLTGSKLSMSSTKFVFFGLISIQKWPPWPIHQKGYTLYSGARYVALWASCYMEHFVQRLSVCASVFVSLFVGKSQFLVVKLLKW